jgi:hypothetical protein
MSQQSVIIHERLALWARQLRPRFAAWPIRWSETRSRASLLRASKQSSCPIVVIELDGRPSRGLEDLDSLLQVAPSALSLVIDPQDRADVAWLARELGATIVLRGIVVPPVVESYLQRWLPLARQKEEQSGWRPPIDSEPEPWERTDLFLTSNPPDAI